MKTDATQGILNLQLEYLREGTLRGLNAAETGK